MKPLPKALLTLATLLLASCSSPQQSAAPPRDPIPASQAPAPQSIITHIIAGGDNASKNGAGEDFCWSTNYYLGDFISAYEAWHDPAWLDAAVKSYDYAIGKMTPGPDGYKGWVGPYGEGSAKVSCDVHVGDAVLIDHMLEFAELVLKDPALKEKYGDAANRYVQLAQHDFVEKWVSRGTWHEDGPYGAFNQWDMFRPTAPNAGGNNVQWSREAPSDSNGVGISLPFNKQNDCAQCMMKLYRITGEKSYRDKAQKIFAFMKSRMQLAGDYYVWNYWEPFGPWDVDLAKADTRHWMNVHGYRNYQAGEIHQIVEAYNTGIVFDKNDIQHILKTNLEVMWQNGDKVHPKWINSNAELPENPLTPEEKKAQEAEAAANPYAKEGRAGTLWDGLLPFDQTIRELYANQLKTSDNIIHKAYFENVTLETPPTFKRRYSDLPVTVFERPWSTCKSLTVACVMPHTVAAGKPSILLCKARRDVYLEVAVYSADGRDKKFVLFKDQAKGGSDGHAGIHILTWDGTDPAGKVKLPAGNYRIRWTVLDGYREFPVTLQ